MNLAGGLRRWIPYLLLAPGLVWLILFFVIPLFTLGEVSLKEGSFAKGFQQTFHWQNFSDTLSEYGEQFLRSFQYGGLATLLALMIGYPLAYAIAFRGGRFKNLLLFLAVLPFFTTYLIRTLAWQTLLADQGPVVGILRTFHILPPTGFLLSTPIAVISSIMYNFLPFMVLPIYVSLEKIDRRLVQAAQDLYATTSRTFLKVILPLSLPGVVAGTLLTFIPAVGDFVNAKLLGGPRDLMIGNVIQSLFLVRLDYPAAAALSFVLMAFILVGVMLYVRVLGTEDIQV
ncbi:MAG TPA: ABC transporter permease [Candidatus Bipolaricaulota bacterium]